MNVSEWQERLERHFTVNGVIGGHLTRILDKEKKYGEYVVKRFKGQYVLIDSFFSFFIETVRTANSYLQKKGWPAQYPQYAPIILFYVTLFKSFRAVENLYTRGYPLDGYALLRDIKDRTIFLGAIINGITSLPKLLGHTSEIHKVHTFETYINLKNEIKKEELRILDLMIRKKSGLREDTIDELQIWEKLFHEEVHGSRLTYVINGNKWIKGQMSLSMGPNPNDLACSLYMNRVNELGWLMLRLFPYLQLEPNSFGPDWAKKWLILDDSFRMMIKELEKIGKKIAAAFADFIDIKFQFNPDTCYHEKIK